MPKVYRVQNKDGRGPYMGMNKDWCDYAHSEYTGRPGPRQDPFLKSHYSSMSYNETQFFIFGFKSLLQLKSWFSFNELFKLSQRGFSIVAIDLDQIDTVHEGENQIIFKLKK